MDTLLGRLPAEALPQEVGVGYNLAEPGGPNLLHTNLLPINVYHREEGWSLYGTVGRVDPAYPASQIHIPNLKHRQGHTHSSSKAANVNSPGIQAPV
ncbi:predicted glutathione S-transferase [Aeropyrum camini SY1 = JCM 12091]|uniref:Predicted glutathione S-transferase n=1 Tax=Aeropyrum camini SY1 = JCM 12091 TaxID=1198449 RepID=U3THC7_9CREN|nr:predicted glutathione S-transferase [Aeropyrum camini SY1 = JCM 12091]